MKHNLRVLPGNSPHGVTMKISVYILLFSLFWGQALAAQTATWNEFTADKTKFSPMGNYGVNVRAVIGVQGVGSAQPT